VLRYRASAMAELMRSLRMLKALQAEQAATPARAVDPEPAPVLIFEPYRGRAGAATQHPPDQGADEIQPRKYPIEPCLAGMWHEEGAPTPCTGWARGVGDRNEPRDLSPSLSVIPPRCSSEPERLDGASP
jgi:hypothetical protein